MTDLRIRLAGRFWVFRLDWRNQLAERIARRLPGRIVYFATIRAFSKAWYDAGHKTPDELTYDEVVKPWERPR